MIDQKLFNMMRNATTAIADHFANEPNREKVRAWCDAARHELVEECSPVWMRRVLISQLDTIDHVLDLIEWPAIRRTMTA
jgi:hypothetical protein